MVSFQEIKDRLSLSLPGPSSWQKMMPSMRNPGALLGEINEPLLQSAVLVLLYPVKNNTRLVLIKRAANNGPHSGQISFPGGRTEPGDKDCIATALREAKEELGIDVSKITVLGCLSNFSIPVSNSEVLPVVGYMNHRPHFSPDSGEVEEVIECPIGLLLDPANSKTEKLTVRGYTITAPYYDVFGHHVWGATAMMLTEFLDVVLSI